MSTSIWQLHPFGNNERAFGARTSIWPDVHLATDPFDNCVHLTGTSVSGNNYVRLATTFIWQRRPSGNCVRVPGTTQQQRRAAGLLHSTVW